MKNSKENLNFDVIKCPSFLNDFKITEKYLILFGNQYSNDEIAKIKENLTQKKEVTFIDFSSLTEITIGDIKPLKYQFPQLWDEDLFGGRDIFSGLSFSELVEYSGAIKSGIAIVSSRELHILDSEGKSISDMDEITSIYLNSISSPILGSRRKVSDKNEFDKEDLDIETLKIITKFENNLKQIRDSGKALTIVPIIRKLLEKELKNIDLTKVSTIQADKNYNIILPGFNNMIIPLSHLTKVVYLLFLENPKGIDIRELANYKKRIVQLYLEISNQNDYEKMLISINDLINIETKAIYTHISRIKNTFFKLMDKSIAENYIIKGEYFGSPLKYIDIIKPKKEQDIEVLRSLGLDV